MQYSFVTLLSVVIAVLASSSSAAVVCNRPTRCGIVNGYVRKCSTGLCCGLDNTCGIEAQCGPGCQPAYGTCAAPVIVGLVPANSTAPAVVNSTDATAVSAVSSATATASPSPVVSAPAPTI